MLVPRDLRQRLGRQVLDLAVWGRGNLERLPHRLVLICAVDDEAEDAQRKPAEIDPCRVRDVLEHELREDNPDRQRTEER